LRGNDTFATVRTEGAMFPTEVLERVTKRDVDGVNTESYHIGGRLNDAINASWAAIQGAWTAFKKARENVEPDKPGTTVTRDKWLLRLFSELGYGRLLPAKTFEIDGKSYPVSHSWHCVPIHLVGFRVDLDKRQPGTTGASKKSPHGLLQEFLNRSDNHLWGFVSNGLRLRVLRDNVSLSRQSYVEFDLEAMMDEGVFPDFSLLWLLCHQSRVESEKPEDCWLEVWTKIAREEGIRALEQLRKGVEVAIVSLGTGFLAHPANEELRRKLKSGTLEGISYYKQVLRFVYQAIFLFVAEDRDLLAPPLTKEEARERYQRYYSMSRLKNLAAKRVGTAHDDLYRVTQLVVDKLGDREGCEELGLPVLNSSLFSPSATPDILNCRLRNSDYLDAIRALTVKKDVFTVPVNYKNLGSEELGSVYESLLELVPVVNLESGMFQLLLAAGSEKKTTGSYYTPTAVITCLLDTALDPVLKRISSGSDSEKEKAILNLKICDPACGSGHFLVGAARRIAARLASVRTGEEEPPPTTYRHALRDVIGRCIYGVDVNPMAVELCKVSLWMEALDPGKPLSFIDHHVRVGNSLLGTKPELVARGIPDGAFETIDDDDRRACTDLKNRNNAVRSGIGPLFAQQDAEVQARFILAATSLEDMPDNDIEQIRQKVDAFSRAESNTDYRKTNRLADSWCAAFIMRKTFAPGSTQAVGLTQRHLNDITNGQPLPAALDTEIDRLACKHHFFHWHLAFPEVFARGGFDCVIGNPPWGAPINKRDKNFLGFFQDTARGRIESAALFFERFVALTKTSGVAAAVLPDMLLHKDYLPFRRLALTRLRNATFRGYGMAFPGVTMEAFSLTGFLGGEETDHITVCPTEGTAMVVPLSAPLGDPLLRINLRYDPEREAIARKMEVAPTKFGHIYEAHEGVHSGNVRAKLFVRTQTSRSCRKLIFGAGEISPAGIAWAGWWVDLSENLVDREMGEYANTGRPEWFAEGGLLVRRTGDRVICCVNDGGYYASNNLFVCVPREPSTNATWVVEVLNSKWLTWLFRYRQPRAGQVFAELKIVHLKHFPIPNKVAGQTNDDDPVSSAFGFTEAEKNTINKDLGLDG